MTTESILNSMREWIMAYMIPEVIFLAFFFFAAYSLYIGRRYGVIKKERDEARQALGQARQSLDEKSKTIKGYKFLLEANGLL